MQVKIYREPENESLILDEEALAKYHELVSSLGIPVVTPKKVPSVYQSLNTAQSRILTALCPLKSRIKAFNKSAIPVEILETIKFVTDNEMFDEIEIWCDDTKPDPLVIGKHYRSPEDKASGYNWNMHSTLIARWGDCAYEFPVLLEMGTERIQQNFMQIAVIAKQAVQNFIDCPDMHVQQFINNGRTPFENIRV